MPSAAPVHPIDMSSLASKDGANAQLETATEMKQSANAKPGNNHTVAMPAVGAGASRKRGADEESDLGSVVGPLRRGRIFRRMCRHFMKLYNHVATQLFLGVCLIVTLFLVDLWTLGNPHNSTDLIKYTILCVIFVIFSLETILLSIANREYFLGFFFWMDILGTLSIVLDIQWMSGDFLSSDQSISRRTGILRAARAAKLGARYARLLRPLKFSKFLDMIPCLGRSAKENLEPSASAVAGVSKKLSEMLSNRVAALIMVLVIVIPFLSYQSTDTGLEAWGENLIIAASNETTTQYDIQNLIDNLGDYYSPGDDYAAMTVNFTTPVGIFFTRFPVDQYVRSENVMEFDQGYTFDGTDYRLKIEWDATVPAQWDAIFGIILIVLVIVCLVYFTASLDSCMEALIVEPLEKMMTTLRNAASNMLKSMQAMDQHASEENKIFDSSEEMEAELETLVLEKMVEKLATIVRNVTGETELALTNNVDKATANWLTQTYASAARKKEEETPEEKAAAAANLALNLLDQPEGYVSKLLEGQSSADPEVVNSWHFDVLKYDQGQLIEVVCYLFDSLNLLAEFKIPVPKMTAFLTEIAGRYNPNPYHNFHHAVDVTQTVFRVVTVAGLPNTLSQLELFALLTASIGHDIGHGGVNNNFLVRTKHELALVHNDRSPLENMHCAQLYGILAKPDLDVQSSLTPAQWRDARKIIINLILGTDMVHHFEQIQKANVFLEVHGESTRQYCRGKVDTIECVVNDEKSKLFFLEMILHSCDISNPFKPFHICSQWADLVVEEFFQQGEREAALGLDISPMMDRRNTNMFNMQLGFIEFVVSPLLNSFVNILPPLYDLAVNITDNFGHWAERRKAEILEAAGPSAAAAAAASAHDASSTPRSVDSATGERKGGGRRKSLFSAKVEPPVSAAPVTPENEECKKLDDRVRAFRDKVTALKLSEASRSRG